MLTSHFNRYKVKLLFAIDSNKVLQTFFRDFIAKRHVSVAQSVQICWLHINDFTLVPPHHKGGLLD